MAKAFICEKCGEVEKRRRDRVQSSRGLTMKKLLVAVVVCGMLCSCGLAENMAVRRRVLQDPSTSARAREAIREGKIFVGMTRDELLASWGPPRWWSPCSRKFMVGGERYETIDFSCIHNCSVVVYLKEGRVIGWRQN